MTDTINNKSRKVSFRLSIEAYRKIEALISNPNNIRNRHSTVSQYCKAVCEERPFRKH